MIYKASQTVLFARLSELVQKLKTMSRQPTNAKNLQVWFEECREIIRKLDAGKYRELLAIAHDSNFMPNDERIAQVLDKSYAEVLSQLEPWLDAYLRINLISGKNDKLNAPHTSNNREIFIVHGHDTAFKGEVTRFVQTLGYKPVVLHEQANKGKTIIEKYEAHSDVERAIVLLTPDDRGRSNYARKWQPRARQNVIFEMGYFMGKLGRTCVICINKGIEKPSDIDGIVYISDKNWKYDLQQELK